MSGPRLVTLGFCLFCTSFAVAQSIPLSAEENSNSLPDSPSAVLARAQGSETRSTTTQDSQPPSTKTSDAQQPNDRSFPIAPWNRLWWNNGKPMDAKQKFLYLVEPAFGPRALVVPLFSAGFRMAKPLAGYPHEWRDGGGAFARNYADSFAHRAATDVGRFLPAAALHEDVRYKPSTSHNPFGRAAHALAFTLVDSTDSGHRTLALSNVVGAAAGGFVGNAYLPDGFNNATHGGQRSLVLFAGFAQQNLMQEFQPEIFPVVTKITRKLHIPHIPLPPVWW